MASVTVIFGGDVVGEFAVEEAVVVVGREATCGIHIDNLGVSRTHCQFIRRGTSYVLQDMNSANGTYVNGSRVGEHYLNDGDEILIGKHTMKYNAVGHAVPAAPAAPSVLDDGMQDGLHTYVMDGAKIRERLAGMSAAEAAGGSPSPIATPAVPTPVGGSVAPTDLPAMPRTAADHATAFDPLKPQRRPTMPLRRPAPQGGGASGGLKMMLYLSLGTNIILIVLIAVLIAVLLRAGILQPRGGYMAPPPAPAPAVTPEAPATP